MKYLTIFSALIFVLAFIDKCESLSCVQCTACSNPHNNVTNPSTACTLVGADTCVKTSIVYPGGSIVQKGCVLAASCSSTSLNLAGYGFWLSCCTTDGCNNSVSNQPMFLTVFAFSLFSFIKRALY